MAPSIVAADAFAVKPRVERVEESPNEQHLMAVPPDALPCQNPSLQVTADHNIKLVDAPVYEPGRGQVLLHVKATGICGSDIHFWKTGRIGELVFQGDGIIGHEAAGIVLKIGEDVDNLQPGDRVAIEPGVSCNRCWLCRDGRYNLCEEVQFAGVYPYAGTIQRYKIHPARWLHKLPDSISFAEGALLEPLSVAMSGIRAGQLSLGRGVLVCGAGPIGLITLAAARASGAHPIVITDLDCDRLAFAKTFVPGCITYQVDRELDAQANGRAIRDLFGTLEYDAPETVLECTGVERSVCTAAYSARRGGKVVVIGVGKEIMNNLPFMHLSLAEIDLRFINRYRDTWPPAIACISGGILDLEKLVTHRVPLEKALDAMAIAVNPNEPSIKILIVDDVDVAW